MSEKFKSTEQQEPVISWEEFSMPGVHPIHNNFFNIFSGRYDHLTEKNDKRLLRIHDDDPKYKAYQRFRKEHVALDLEIRRLLQKAEESIKITGESICPHLEKMSKLLYQAYLIMRGYGFTDRELFR